MRSVIVPMLQELKKILEDNLAMFCSHEEIAKILRYEPTNYWEICRCPGNYLVMIEYNNKDKFRMNDTYFQVSREPFDDAICTYVGNKDADQMIKCLVKPESLANFVCAAIFDTDVEQSWLYKNKPKIGSSYYAQDLYDISIVVP